MNKRVVRGRMEDPIVHLIVRDRVDSPQANIFVCDTRQVPQVGDEIGFGSGPLYKVVSRCWAPLGDQGERPWAVYLRVEPMRDEQ